MIKDLQDQLMLVRQELTEVHETLDSQYCIKGGKLDDVSNRHARRKVQDVVSCTSRALEFLLSYGITPDLLKCHTTTGKLLTMPLLSGTTDIDNSDSTEANLRVLYLLDRFGVSNKFYEELSMLFSELPRSNAVKKSAHRTQ